MKEKITYITRDGQEFGSSTQAQDHSLTQAQRIIQRILDKEVQPSGYFKAKAIVSVFAEDKAAWIDFMQWMHDADFPETDEE